MEGGMSSENCQVLTKQGMALSTRLALGCKVLRSLIPSPAKG